MGKVIAAEFQAQRETVMQSSAQRWQAAVS